MPSVGPTELIIIAVVLILLFGSKKLPDAARSLGRSMRILKSEVKEMQHDGEAPVQPQAAIEQQPVQPTQPYQQPVQPAQPAQQPYQQPQASPVVNPVQQNNPQQ